MYGVINFSTDDNIPYYQEYNDIFDNTKKKMSTLVGKMQKLYLGSEYTVKCTYEFNQKYNSHQYIPISIVPKLPKTLKDQKVFLQTFATETIVNNLLGAYPNLVNMIINGEEEKIDYLSVKGVGEKTWSRIKNSVIENYLISDIIIMLQPIGVTFNTIKKLLLYEPNPILLKEKLNENPYVLTSVSGLGFKKVDSFAIALKPELLNSVFRFHAFIQYYLSELGNSEGHTYVTVEYLVAEMSNVINECSSYFNRVEQGEIKFLHLSNDKKLVGLKQYFEIEKNVYDILDKKTNFKIKKFKFDTFKVDNIINNVEIKQGFKYTNEQLINIKNIINEDVCFLTGKAGTGKTSIMNAVLSIYKEHGYNITSCALAAKAAQRITEATGQDANTIHFTLGATGIKGFNFNSNNKLSTDLVFIDESSMINASLFYSLLEAIDYSTRIVICGDHKQLPPIGFGNVFSDLLLEKKFNIYELTEVLRQAKKSGIVNDANLIRESVNPINKLDLKIINGELQDMYYIFRENREVLRNMAVNTYLKSVKEDGLDDIVITIPRRDNCLNSAQEINAIIQDELISNNVPFVDCGFSKLKLGAKVIQIKNNKQKNVYNGEIGYITNIKQEDNKNSTTTVLYKNGNEEKEVLYNKNDISEISLAYALTTHKLQGSGYKTVIGIVDMTHFKLLDNCMLYTLISRAKGRCLLLSEPNAFIKCISTSHNLRNTWMQHLIKENK